ncbi:hypothetical protein [Paenibacillus whitsoniae]|uniref:hypothetical protein n=1 Tax=Paenibacillus whitsoniae TaxID=2496558 RepID=UPI0013E07E57|nr:hypothetical protein [Paenibacillus whitsoniae]
MSEQDRPWFYDGSGSLVFEQEGAANAQAESLKELSKKESWRKFVSGNPYEGLDTGRM